MGSTGVQRGPRSKKGPPVSKCAQLGSKWLKMASTPVKMGQNRLQRGPEGVPRGPKGSKWQKMASNTPKYPFPGQICLSPHRRGSTQHSKMGGAGTGTPQRGFSGSVHDFCPKVYIGYPPTPLLPYVHRVPPTLCTLLGRTREPSRSTLR